MDNIEWMWKFLADTKGIITLDASGDRLKLSVTVFGGTCVFDGACLEDVLNKLRAVVDQAKCEEIVLDNAGWRTTDNSVWTKVLQCPFTRYEKTLIIRRQIDIHTCTLVVMWQYLRFKSNELQVVAQRSTLYELFEAIEADLSDNESEAHKDLFYMAH